MGVINAVACSTRANNSANIVPGRMVFSRPPARFNLKFDPAVHAVQGMAQCAFCRRTFLSMQALRGHIARRACAQTQEVSGAGPAPDHRLPPPPPPFRPPPGLERPEPAAQEAVPAPALDNAPLRGDCFREGLPSDRLGALGQDLSAHLKDNCGWCQGRGVCLLPAPLT